MKNTNFPTFYFDGNAFFGLVDSFEDLKLLFVSNKHLRIDSLLDVSRISPLSSILKFGLRSECNGVKTLRNHFKENGFSMPPGENMTIDEYINIMITENRNNIIDNLIG